MKLKTAILGLGEEGSMLLETASGSCHYQIEAIADRDGDAAGQLAQAYKCTAFDDYRQLIVQTELDCLLVAAPIHQCDEHIRGALKKSTHVLKMAPPGRDFEQTSELGATAAEEGVKFAVGNPQRFESSYCDMHEQLCADTAERPLLVSISCEFPEQERSSWSTDPLLAGGGVLLQNCYHIIDWLTWTFGLPQQVYALNTSIAGDRQQRQYVTEDIAAVTMKFHDMLIVNLSGSRGCGIKTGGELWKFYFKEKVFSMPDGGGMQAADEPGMSNKGSQPGRRQSFSRMLDSFALSILSPDKNAFISTPQADMQNMAVIKAAYLSARTGFPEEPAKGAHIV